MALTKAFLSSSFSVHGSRASKPAFMPQVHAPDTLKTSSSSGFDVLQFGRSLFRNRSLLYASAYDLNAVGSGSVFSDVNSNNDTNNLTDDVPTPTVLIDQDSDSDATIVLVSFGDRLGDLLDMMKELKDLGLAVLKGTVSSKGSVRETKFLITDTGHKVEEPYMLEKIRLTIISNLLKYHPESSEQLVLGMDLGITTKKLDVPIATKIEINPDGPKGSLMYIETPDRQGLVVEIMYVIFKSDTWIHVEPAEINTEGLVAKLKFHVSYDGKALSTFKAQALHNMLYNYLVWCVIED